MRRTLQSLFTLGQKLAFSAALVAGIADGANAQVAAQAARAQAQINPNAIFAAAYAAQEPTTLGNLQVVNSGSHKYTWSRFGHSFKLINRHGSWTREHALWVRDALDKLPEVIIRKARQSGMDKLYRDGARPDMPLSSVFGIDNAAALAVPQAPWKFVAYGDGTFHSAETTYDTTTHELIHCVHWYEITNNLSQGLAFSNYSWLPAISLIGDNGLKSWNGFVSDYARSNFREDFAESGTYYWHSPDSLYAANTGKYWYMRNVVFQGAVSPAEVRLNQGLPERIKPLVSGLSSYSGVNLTVRDVYGQYFMAPFDGGYNKVRFGGTTALHVPLSRTHMYATVPVSAGAGWTSVTVETQDGRSNGVNFKVEKPWWKFW